MGSFRKRRNRSAREQRNLSSRSYIKVPKRHRTVIALEQQWIPARFRDLQVRTRASLNGIVLLNQLPVVEHLQKPRILRLPSVRAKSRSLKEDMEPLPLAWRQTRIHTRRRAADRLVIDPSVINRAAV